MTGEDLRALIHTLGHTQETAAEEMGIVRRTLVRWLQTDQLSPRTQLQIAQLRPLDATTATLLPLVKRLLETDVAGPER